MSHPELVDRLRMEAKYTENEFPDKASLMKEAANVIEELAVRASEVPHLRSTLASIGELVQTWRLKK